jgi:hypothetical protein
MRKHKHSKNIITGWVATLDDGSTRSEFDGTIWAEVKRRVVGLCLVAKGTVVTLPVGMRSYTQGKTASCPVCGGDITIESRWIGFYAPSGDKITTRVDEATGKVSIEVEKDDPISNDKKL